MTPVVLFAQTNSIYKSLDCDVYDIKRNALTFNGDEPVIAHPPCRGWGRLRTFSNHSNEELDLAFFAIEKIRKNGGVLEHPASSSLWDAADLPKLGLRDNYGGFTFPIYQSDFGHQAPKLTWLYIVGINPEQLPEFPLILSLPLGRVENLSRKLREATPLEFAKWLINLVFIIRIERLAKGNVL
jgi:hypothetical protein